MPAEPLPRIVKWTGTAATLEAASGRGNAFSDFRRGGGFPGALGVCGAHVSLGVRDAAMRGKPRWQRMKRVLSAGVHAGFSNFSLVETALLLVLSGGDF